MFAEPGASAGFSGETNGRWAIFLARESNLALDATGLDAAVAATVQGASAVISSSPFQFQIDFGPVDGRVFTVTTGGLSRAESLAFAEAVGVDDGVPVLTDDGVLGAMQPVGSIADYGVATSTVFQALFQSEEGSTATTVRYGEYSVTSRSVVGNTTLATLRFFLDGEEGKQSVHGQRAFVADISSDAFGGRANSVVAWVESGRLVVVSSPDDVAATLALAETTRRATADEWAEVVAHSTDPVPNFGGSDPVTLYNELDPASGDRFFLSAIVVDGVLTMCAQDHSNGGGLASSCETESYVSLPLLLATDHSIGPQFVLAMIDLAERDGAELRITLADGTVEALPLFSFGPLLPGAAVGTLLPEGHGVVQLWNAGEVVATL